MYRVVFKRKEIPFLKRAHEKEVARLIEVCRKKDERIAEAEGDRDKLKKDVGRLKAELEAVEKRISIAIKSVFN